MGRCKALKTLNIPSSVEIIGDHAFFLWTGLVDDVHLREGLKTIGANAFGVCSSLSKIRIPSTVETMGKLAFADCFELKEVVYDSDSKLNKLEGRMFSGCISLTDINLPPSIQEIGMEAFIGCRKLKSMDLPKQLAIIRDSAFQNCIKLQVVQLHHRLTIIEDRAFIDCHSLLKIEIPFTVEAIGICAFSVSVELQPDSDVAIEDRAFACNDGLCNFSSEDSPGARISVCALSQSTVEDSDEDGEDDNPEFWKSRYRGYLVHSMCYHASTTNALQLRRAIALWKPPLCDDDGPDVQFRKHAIDQCGMTPFHVLLSAAKRRRDLLEVLLEEYPLHMLGWKNTLGRRPLNSLIGNWTGEAKEMMKIAVQKWMIDRMATWGLQVWRENISSRLNKLLKTGESKHPMLRFPILDGIYDQFYHFERMEATSFLELWLWKMEIRSTSRKECKRILLDRGSSRHRCGATFVIPTVITYLPHVDEVADDDSGQSDDEDGRDNEDDSDSAAGFCYEVFLSDAKCKRLRSWPSTWDDASLSSENGDDESSE
ncbi:unnamed protein product [Cylindrotheca closterium]|uniref:Uncharacterized protein n=1 Tax=Cylindrotheca closterium TaxID=2856 RepID=A0AAD2G451_9STRA|nr:unnamed protein product [Cylindrotheca closterium]